MGKLHSYMSFFLSFYSLSAQITVAWFWILLYVKSMDQTVASFFCSHFSTLVNKSSALIHKDSPFLVQIRSNALVWNIRSWQSYFLKATAQQPKKTFSVENLADFFVLSQEEQEHSLLQEGQLHPSSDIQRIWPIPLKSHISHSCVLDSFMGPPSQKLWVERRSWWLPPALSVCFPLPCVCCEPALCPCRWGVLPTPAPALSLLQPNTKPVSGTPKGGRPARLCPKLFTFSLYKLSSKHWTWKQHSSTKSR